MKKRIAFFDFDGTITTRDTLLEIIKFQKGNFKFYLGFIINSPFIIAWKAGIISNQAAKERMLQYFFGKLPVNTFQQRCDEFAANKIPELIRPKAMHEIATLKASGAEVVIVSASAENWIQQWCSMNDLQLIGTKLQVKNDLLTGKIENFNCHGQEKVNRINAAFNLSLYDEIYCYGDTKGDKPMLRLATFSFYKPFR
ncbi:MAG: HAD-IB family hydrolase [Chitinophagaceae bacterium]